MKFGIYILILLSITSCIPEKSKKIKEGYIEYDVTYLNKEKESLYSFMLPKKMIVTFNKHKIKSSLEGFSGNFSFSTISCTKSDSAFALFHIMNQKYFYIENKKGASDLFGNLPGLMVKHLKDTSYIADIKCKKAFIESSLDSFAPFHIYYTKDIKINNPNKKNPFNEIDGILMDFTVNLYNMDMRFVANNITETYIPNSEFNIPKDYQRINRKAVDKLIYMLQ